MIIVIIYFLIFILIPAISSAAVKTWDGRGSNVLWSNGTNWSPDGVPLSGGDDIAIEGGGTVHMDVNVTLTGTLNVKWGESLS